MLSSILAIFLLLTAYSSASAGNHHFLENGNPTLHGMDAGYLIDTPTREKIDLAGSWEFVTDEGEKGTVRVPAADEGSGMVTYSRSFEVTADQIDRSQFHLVMLGVNYSAEISINGEFVGNHVGGYTSFIQAIPKDLLQVGKENRIQISVSSVLDSRKTVPVRPRVWEQHNDGGILRDVYILTTPSQYVRDVGVKTEPAAKGAAEIVGLSASIEGPFVAPRDSVEVPSPKGTRFKPAPVPFPAVIFEVVERLSGTPVAHSAMVPLVRKGDEWEEARATMKVEEPKLWAPDTPELYLLRCRLVRSAGKDTVLIDEYDVSFGIRHFLLEDANIMLNGRRLVLKGVLWNEQHPGWGSAVPYEQMEKDIVLIKNLGANAVRFAGHPPHPYMLDLCDRYGLVAMEELPVNGVPPSLLRSESYGELASGMAREMIVRDRNHPSVLAWGLGDDYESSNAASRAFLASLAAAARGLDSRPLYYGTSLLAGDTCSDLVELACVNAPGGDLKAFRSQLEAWRDLHEEKPVIVLRLGTEVQQENRNGYSDPLSQEAQARYFVQRLDALKALEFDGEFVWSYNDYRGARPALTVHSGDPMLCSNGLVSGTREKRIAYDAVRAVFRGEKFVALPAGTYSSNAPIIYVLTGFVVLVGVAYLYNANRRFRESVNRSFFNTYNFFADVRDQRIVSLVQTTVLGLVVSIALAIVLSSILYHFRDNIVLDNLLTTILISDTVKSAAVRLIWHPVQFIAVATAVFFAILILASFGLLLLKLVFRTRIFMFHSYAVCMWSTTPLLLFIPAGMILYRVMDSSVYVIPSLVFVGILCLWVLLRFLKGVSIIFDVSIARTYLLGAVAVIVLVGALYLYYDSTRALPQYISYMYNLHFRS